MKEGGRRHKLLPPTVSDVCLSYTVDEQQLDHILEQVKIPLRPLTPTRRAEMQDRLGSFFLDFLHERAWEKEPPASEAVEQFDKIAHTAEKLLGLLPGENGRLGDYLKSCLTDEAERYGEENGGYPNLPPVTLPPETGPEDNDDTELGDYTYYRGLEQFQKVVYGIALMREWAIRAKSRDEPHVGTKKGHVGDRPLQNLLVALGELWHNISGRPPRFSSYPGREPYGPFMRFVQACLETLRSGQEVQHLTYGLDLTPAAIKSRYDRAKKLEKDDEPFLLQHSQDQK